jgi:DNA-binding response OmpR family regulator
MQILIAGEEPALSQFLKHGLEMDAYEVRCLHDAEAVTAAVETQPPDLLIFDLPSGGGELLTHLRSIDDRVPILVLTASRDVESRVGCLDRGADDCMTKPLSLQELRARCRALLRRRSETSLVLRYEGLELNRIRHTVEQQGRPVALTRTEFSLLEYLMMHRGSCVSRAALVAQVWAQGTPADSNIVDVYINYLRRKLGKAKAAPMIQTVRGRGYLVGSSPAGTLPPRAHLAPPLPPADA